MQAITQVWLITLSQTGAWGDVQKPQQDMTFILVAPSIAIRCEWVFGLMAVWAHSCQAHFKTLEEATHRLVLLADASVDWPYAFVWLNDAMSYVPLMNKGHISTMMDGVPHTDTCSWLHQLQIQKLLQHQGKVVQPEGLNGDLEALQLTFPELPLWDVAFLVSPSESHYF